MRLLTVVGARPQFIKAAVVSRAIESTGKIQETLIHSGQHYDHAMSKVFFEELGIPEPEIHLGVGSGSHAVQTGRIMIELEEHCMKLRPDVVLVYGDTNTTLAASLVAAKSSIPLAHVEAGLRSFNRTMPEEVNRIVTDSLSTYLFAPTRVAVANLNREGVDSDRVHLVGDVMFDAALAFRERALAVSSIRQKVGLETGAPYVLATIHRAANTDSPERIVSIYRGLQRVSQELPVVWPVHPRAREAMKRAGLSPQGDCRLRLTDPVGYLDMVSLEAGASVIVTDSGGVQKEAFFHRVPCVTVRQDTEWTELVDAGVNCLCGPGADDIHHAFGRMIRCEGDWSRPDFGDGHASEKIAGALEAVASGVLGAVRPGIAG
mgnify:CR=1 FL=1